MSDAAHDGEDARRNAYRDAVSKQRARFQALVEHLPSAIALLDANGQFEYVSPSVEEMSGHRPEDLVGENAFEYIHPDDRLRVEEVFAEGLSEPNRVLTVEYRYRHVEGHWIHVESRGHNRLRDPAVEGFVVNTRDVSTERRALRQLRQERDLNRRLLEVAPQPMAVVDADGVVERANDAARAAFGVGEAQIAGMHPAGGNVDAYDTDGEPVPPERTVSGRVRATGDPVEDVTRVWVGPDGARYRVTLDGAPLADDGDVRRVVLSFDSVERL